MHMAPLGERLKQLADVIFLTLAASYAGTVSLCIEWFCQLGR